MKNAGMPEIMVEYMMGHEIGGTRAAYYQRKVDEIKENYLRCMPAVIIQPTETQVLASKEYKELNEKIELYEAALKERNGERAKLREEMEAIYNKYNKFMEYPLFYGVSLELIREALNELVEVSRESFELKPDFKNT